MIHRSHPDIVRRLKRTRDRGGDRLRAGEVRRQI